MNWNDPEDENNPGGLKKTLQDMQDLLDVVPDAYIFIRLNMNPNVEWINSRPEEQVLFSDGTHEPVLCTSAVGGMNVDGMVSFASEAWRRDGEAALREYVAELEKSPLFDHVIGFFLSAGGTGEWYYPDKHRMHNEEKNTYADCSEPFRKAYETWLREKYGTEEALQRVWNRSDARFEKPIIPNLYERVHIYDVHRMIEDRLEYEDRLGDYVDRMAMGEGCPPSNLGVFLNANEYYHTADFFAALNDTTAGIIDFFAGVLKELKPDLLVGAFYGYFGCCDYYGASHTTGALALINSEKIDFLAGPGVYNNREPGGVTAQREMQDSMRIRNKIYICEDDMHTHLSDSGHEDWFYEMYTAQDSVNVLKRDFSRNLCEDLQGWWYDMSSEGKTPWFDDPDILEMIRRQQVVAKYAYSLDRTKKNEIAVLYDTESVHMVADIVDQVVLDYYRTSDLHRIGAPIDYYFHNDVEMEQMPDYKMYIVLNVYCLTDREREAICAKARRNNALVLWLYAPGFINPASDTIMDLSNIEKTVGMKLCMREGTSYPFFFAEKSGHPAIRYADQYRRYGYIDRDIHSNVWVGKNLLPTPFMDPAFYVEDEDVTVLGRYCKDGKVAYAMREDLGYTSVYCSTWVLRNELLASLAEYAGCHLYNHGDDVIYANENFVSIHASTAGVKRIWFKKTCSPYEVYEEKSYGCDVNYIDVEMYPGETKLWSLHGEW
jgi:hypothetical protein